MRAPERERERERERETERERERERETKLIELHLQSDDLSFQLPHGDVVRVVRVITEIQPRLPCLGHLQ